MKNHIKILLFTSASLLLYFLKCFIAQGLHGIYFSGFALFGPLVGFYAGLMPAFFIVMLRCFIKILFFGAPVSLLSWHIPTLCASAYLLFNTWFIRIGIPLLCMFLFCIHLVGGKVWFYSLYWLIPITLYAIKNQSMFFQFLGSTFTAHAVGSVMWLYCLPMHAETFVALMPIVPLERFICASAMTLCFYGIRYFDYYIKKYILNFSRSISYSSIEG